MKTEGSAGVPAAGGNPAQLDKGLFWLSALALSAANFMVVLNMTVANVSVPNIAGGLAATTSQGTWVITSYVVGEAITVPLTGWLAARFGPVRVFVWAALLFGVFGFLSGCSTTLGLLVFMRVFQGIAGGPLMPLSQTLLMRIFPKDKSDAAIGLWTMTTMVAPVIGPILGGYICDDFSWPWIFFINTPVAVLCAFFTWKLMQGYEEAPARNPIDVTGLILLIVWVAPLQLMLDQGKDLDWFASSKIIALCIIAVTGLAAFIIWEWYEEHPIVDLRIFRHRGYSVSIVTICLAFASLIGVILLTPLWLQAFMGYTATIAGFAMAWSGVLSVFALPVVAFLITKVDIRKLVFAGALWFGGVTIWRSLGTTDMGFWDISIPLIWFGLAMPFILVPTTALALGSVEEREMDNAAGVMNFLRTLSGAFVTSIVMTTWNNAITRNHAELAGLIDSDNSVRDMLWYSGTPPGVINNVLDYLCVEQSAMLATNQITAAIGFVVILAGLVIWLAPKPERIVDPAAGGSH